LGKSIILDFIALICAYDVIHYVIPGRPGILGIRMAVPEFPGMKKGVRECKL